MNKVEQNTIIRNRILYLLKKKNLTLTNLAKRSKIRQSTLNSIINDETIPTLSTLLAISEGFEITITELLDIPEFQKKEA